MNVFPPSLRLALMYLYQIKVRPTNPQLSEKMTCLGFRMQWGS